MRQPFLPGFPEGAEKIDASLSILRKDGHVTYFIGSNNYFSHREGDKSEERFAIASLMVNGHGNGYTVPGIAETATEMDILSPELPTELPPGNGYTVPGIEVTRAKSVLQSPA